MILVILHLQYTFKQHIKNAFSCKPLYNQTWSKLYFCKTLWKIKKLFLYKLIKILVIKNYRL